MAADEEPGDRRGAERAKVLEREAEEEEESLDLEARRIEETVERIGAHAGGAEPPGL